MQSNGCATSDEKALLFALGLCAKAGHLVCGVPMICEALSKAKPPCVVVAAADNANNSAKRLADRCAYYGVALAVSSVDGETLAHAVGKSGRLSAVAVTDENLAILVRRSLPPTEQ